MGRIAEMVLFLLFLAVCCVAFWQYCPANRQVICIITVVGVAVTFYMAMRKIASKPPEIGDLSPLQPPPSLPADPGESGDHRDFEAELQRWRNACIDWREKAASVVERGNATISRLSLESDRRRILFRKALWACVLSAAATAFCGIICPVRTGESQQNEASTERTSVTHAATMAGFHILLFGAVGVGSSRWLKRQKDDPHPSVGAAIFRLGFLAVLVANLCGLLISLPYHADNLSRMRSFGPHLELPLAFFVITLRLLLLPLISWISTYVGFQVGNYIRSESPAPTRPTLAR